MIDPLLKSDVMKPNRKILVLTLALIGNMFLANAQQSWTLKACVEYALENNISIQQANLNIMDADISTSSAQGNFLPSLNASTASAWNNGLTANPVTGVREVQTVQNTSLGANLSVDIFNGLRNVEQLKRAKLNKLAVQYQLEDIKDNVSLNVASSFLNILFNKEALKVLQGQLEVTKHQLEVTQGMIVSGISPKGDLLETEAAIASQEQQIVIAENNVRIALISLAQMLTLDNYETFDIAIDEITLPAESILNMDPNDIFIESLTHRNDIKASEVNVDLAMKDIKIAKTSQLPSLTGFYNFNTLATNLKNTDRNPTGILNEDPFGESASGDQLFSYGFETTIINAKPLFDQFSQNKSHSFGLNLSIPIFNKFSIKNNIQRNKVNLERNKLSLTQTKINLESRIHQAYNDAKGAYKAFHAAEKTLSARKEAFKYAEERHKVGVLNAFEFAQSRQLLETAESDLVRSKYDYLFKIKVLEFFYGKSTTDI